jgi:predicted aminopeptidase
VLSSMLGGGDEELPWFTNTILHESVHATVFVPDEQFFNETFAAYIADALTDAWIARRFGPGSPEDLAWTLGQAVSLPRVARQLATYRALKEVYESKRPRAQKLAEKARIIDELVADLRLRRRPNNATINDVRLYNGGTAALKQAHRDCGDLRSLLEAAKTLGRGDFRTSLQEDLTPIGRLLAARCHRSTTPARG